MWGTGSPPKPSRAFSSLRSALPLPLSVVPGPSSQLTSSCLRSLADLPNAHGLSVDWVSRNLFWTSYDANKKQINVARLDGSFKNAVIQGLDKPHCLVVHPLRG